MGFTIKKTLCIMIIGLSRGEIMENKICPFMSRPVGVIDSSVMEWVDCQKEECMAWGKVKQYDNDGRWVKIEGCKLIHKEK